VKHGGQWAILRSTSNRHVLTTKAPPVTTLRTSQERTVL
jgi:hypothetical protein